MTSRTASTRRRFLAGLAGLVGAVVGLVPVTGCAPLAAEPAPRRLRRIGFLAPREPGAPSLHRTLPELGWVEGRDFAIELRHADGDYERLATVLRQATEIFP